MPVLPASTLSPARFSFIDPSGQPGRWHVRRFELREALSEPYRLEIELSTADRFDDPDELLGAACTLYLARLTVGRCVHGIVRDVEPLGGVADLTRVRLVLVPALALLAMQRNTRFWQHRSAVEILDEILTAPLAALGRTLRLQLDEGTYRPREYCVQYRETDLEFAVRLMHEEGIVYAFEHPGDRTDQPGAEELVLLDTTVRAPDLDIPPLPLLPRGTAAAAEQSVDTLEWTRSLGTTSVVQRDWDWSDPVLTPYHRECRGVDGRDRDRERYDHEDRRLHTDDGERRARYKLDAETGPTRVARGSSDVLEMIPGRSFELQAEPERGGRHLLLAVTHTGDAPEEHLFTDVRGERARYGNDFRSARPDHPWRSPQPPARPRVHGPHTALVVGPESEEIHTDEHGRIKVRFHWDRLSPPDDSASCWIRVAQTWAGPGWGHQFIPRIGMEVLVDFIDGDPDRPLVVGCVYNALFRPPFPLPDQKTQSGVKTESSPGGGGFNEIRFEDAKGREELFIHAQRDLNEKVLHSNSRTVTADQTFRVGGNQSFTITKNRSVTVTDGDESLNVSAGSSSTTVKKNRSVTVTDGDSGLTVQQGTHTATVKKAIAMTSQTANVAVTANTAVDVTAETSTLTATAKQAVTVQSTDATALIVAKQGATLTSTASTLSLSGNTAVTLNSATATLSMSSKAAATLMSGDTVGVGAPNGVVLDGGKQVMVTADTVAITGKHEITLSAGTSTISIKPDGITVSGPNITSKAIGMHQLSGALIKIN